MQDPKFFTRSGSNPIIHFYIKKIQTSLFTMFLHLKKDPDQDQDHIRQVGFGNLKTCGTLSRSHSASRQVYRPKLLIKSRCRLNILETQQEIINLKKKLKMPGTNKNTKFIYVLGCSSSTFKLIPVQRGHGPARLLTQAGPNQSSWQNVRHKRRHGQEPDKGTVS